MKRLTCALGVVLSAFGPGAEAEVYRCERDGKVLYTDRKCEGAEPVEIDKIDPQKAVEAQKRMEELKQQREEERKNRLEREKEEARRREAAEAARREAEREAQRRMLEAIEAERRRQEYNRSLWDNY